MYKRLSEISDLAVQNYSLLEIFEELELPHSLLDDISLNWICMSSKLDQVRMMKHKI